MSLLRTDTHEQQSKLANYCRTAVPVELVGTTEGRLHHYRRLVFNVLKDALSSSYPLTVNLFNTKEWSGLCHDFFEQHACEHPQVWRMPFELIAFIDEHRPDLHQKYPVLKDLLWLEWKEIEYYMMPDRAQPSSVDDFWNKAWSLNAESEILVFEYPVHMKNARFISRTDAAEFYCLIFRQPDTFKVRFMNFSPFFAWLLTTMTSENDSLASLLAQNQEQFNIGEAQINEHVRPFYEKLKTDGMVI